MSAAERAGAGAGGAAPRVYVILVNFKGWALTVECLESLLRQDYPDYQVVVCENGSPDDSLERIRAWAAGAEVVQASGTGVLRARVEPPVAKPVRMVEYTRAQAEAGGGPEAADAPVVLVSTGDNLGFTGGNNVGLRYALARGDTGFVWVLNNDTVVAPDALARLVAAAQADPSLGMVGSKLVYFDEPDVIQAAAGGALVRWKGTAHLSGSGEPDRGQWDRPFEPEYVHGASLLVREQVCREVGLFDERYFIYFEEVDWAIRTKQAGWRLGYAHDSVVWHKESRTMGRRTPWQDYHVLRSSLILARKFHPGLLPVMMCYTLYRHLLPKVVRRQPERLRAVMRAYRDFVTQDLRPR